MTLIADGFLAGSLLSLLLPVALLIALVYWYVKFIRRVPETADERQGGAAATASNAGPGVAPATASTTGVASASKPGSAEPGAVPPPGTAHTPE